MLKHNDQFLVINLVDCLVLQSNLLLLRCVYEIASKYDIPIIGCGGISTWEDAIEFFLAGASAIQLGSAIGDNWINVFDDINKGVLQYMKKKNYSTIEEMVGLAKKF